MLFASTSLAGRIEHAQSCLISACMESVARNRPDADVWIQAIGSGRGSNCSTRGRSSSLPRLRSAWNRQLDSTDLLTHPRGSRIFAPTTSPSRFEAATSKWAGVCRVACR